MADFRPTRFEILPPIIKNLILLNAVVFLAQNVLGPAMEIKILNTFALHSWQSPLFRPWQFVSHMFMHGDIGHIFFNMYALWMFGSILENVWGPKRFLLFYLVCGLGAALCHMFALYYEMKPYIEMLQSMPMEMQQIQMSNPGFPLNTATLGASGAVFGCLAGFAYLFPNTQLYIILINIPIKAKWFVLIYAAIELGATIRNSAGDNVAHIAHLGGALVGFLLVFFWNKTNKKTFY